MPKVIECKVTAPKNTSIECALPKGVVTEVYLPGRSGPAGHTPVRGVDYFTDADIDAMVDAVAARFEDGDKEAY